MTETGIVYSIKRDTATVRFERKTACANCRMCLKPKNEMYVEVKVNNVLNAKVGDKVVVEMGERAVVTASLIVYLVPLIPVAVALILTKNSPVWVGLAATLGVLAVSYVGIALLDKFVIRKKEGFVPKMRVILTGEESETIHNGGKQ